jgi:transmembrane protein DUF3566
MPYIIRRVAVGSAFKVGLAVSALMAAIFGLIGLLMQASLMGLISSAVNNSGNFPGGSGNFATFGLASSCIFYGISVVMAALFGGIGGAVAAFFYNLAAGWFGGLQIELSTPNVLDQMGTGTPEKRKNIYEQ